MWTNRIFRCAKYFCGGLNTLQIDKIFDLLNTDKLYILDIIKYAANHNNLEMFQRAMLINQKKI